MRLRNCFLCCMLFFWTGSQNGTGQIFRAQNKPEVLFENIYVGDDLEKCLAKGTIQHNPDYKVGTIAPNQKNMLELANSNIANSYFSYTGVWFDNYNIVKEIELNFHQKESGKTAKEVFNFMTQYFCQRYQGMRTETIKEHWTTNDSYKFKYEKEGIKNIWETNKVRITLQFYSASRIDKSSVYDENGDWSLALSVREDIAKRYYDGNWVELEIIAK